MTGPDRDDAAATINVVRRTALVTTRRHRRLASRAQPTSSISAVPEILACLREDLEDQGAGRGLAIVEALDAPVVLVRRNPE